jgi:PPOX class probable F420-dependent enzyme
VTPEQAREFLRTHHRAVLLTTRSDGSPQLSPVLAGVDAAGRVIVSTRATAMKARNLRRDPRAWLCVLSDQFYGPWVQVGGRAELVDMPAAWEGLVDYYRRVAGEHPDWAEYRRAMEKERRVLVRVDIEQAGPSVAG